MFTAIKVSLLAILMLSLLFYHYYPTHIAKMNLERHLKLNTGKLIPRIGLGTGTISRDRVVKTINAALERGYRSFDTAFLYQNERAIGDGLNNWFSQGKLKREEVFVTSKLPAIANRPEDVDTFLKKSLKSLQLDYLDLYLIHQPFGLKYMGDDNVFAKGLNGDSVIDFKTDLEAIWRAMEVQVAAGRVKAIGVSNFNKSQIDRIVKVAKVPPAVNQVELHLYLHQPSLLEKCKEHGIVVTAYSPLGAPYNANGAALSPTPLANPKVIEIGKKYGKTSAQVLLRFLLQLDVVVIPQSARPERLKSNIDIYDFVLSDSEMQTLKQLDRGEKGRIYPFRDIFPGCVKHKEYPFPLVS